MENLKNVVQEFVENFSFSEDCQGIAEHYARNENDLTQENHQGRSLVLDFIEYISQENEQYTSNAELLEMVENLVDTFLDGVPNMYDEDIAKNIPLFWNWIEDFWDKESFYDTMRATQQRGYTEALNELIAELLLFLEKNVK